MTIAEKMAEEWASWSAPGGADYEEDKIVDHLIELIEEAAERGIEEAGKELQKLSRDYHTDMEGEGEPEFSQYAQCAEACAVGKHRVSENRWWEKEA